MRFLRAPITDFYQNCPHTAAVLLPCLTADSILLPLPREQQASEQRSQQPIFLLLVLGGKRALAAAIKL
jgi:hypothetical protein